MEKTKKQDLMFYPTSDSLMAYNKDQFIFTDAKVDYNLQCVNFEYLVNQQYKISRISFDVLQNLIEGKIK